MIKFSMVDSVGGRAKVVTREMFEEVLDRPQVAELCRRIAEEGSLAAGCPDQYIRDMKLKQVGEWKRCLPAFCWHANFKDGKRNNFAAEASGLTMLDVDHVDEPEKVFERVRERAISLGLVAAHVTPSCAGLRLVFVTPEGMVIEEAQKWLTSQLNLEGVDGCTKDLARLSFIVPRGYWLYVNYDVLFGEASALPGVKPQISQIDTDLSAHGHSPLTPPPAPSPGRGILTEVSPATQGDVLTHSALGYGGAAPSGRGESVTYRKEGRGVQGNGEKAGRDESVTYREEGRGVQSNEEKAGRGESVMYEKEYKGLGYDVIVECLETLYGGKPEHGNRNTQIFSMACLLRYICNDDPVWIEQVLPTYGEAESKWRASIRSACARNQSQSMPPMLLQAIEMAKLKVAQGENLSVQNTAAFDDSEPPKMPARLPKLIRHLIKNVPEVCRESVANAVFPSLATHLSEVNFRLIDGTKKEATFMCVTMARQSSGKASINKPIEYIMADIKEKDDINRRREQEWKDSLGTKGANKEKPKRPDDLCIQMLVTDMTNAAFVQRLKDAGDKYVFTSLEELDMLRQLQTNGMKDVGKIICLCFDNGVYGQERVGAQSVTALLPLRWNWNASSTVEKGLEFFRNRLIDGTLSRINFCTIVNDDSKDFIYGDYDEQYAAELKPYITNLNLCKGEVSCPKALEMARRLQKQCQEIALQTEDTIYQEFSYRAVTIAYMKAMVLYIANDMTWDKSIEDFCEWSLQYDLWCKNHFFGQEIKEARDNSKNKHKKRGRVNMLQSLPDVFSLADAQEMRKRAEMDVDGTRNMLKSWVHRGYIVFNDEREMYEKTTKYKSKN